MPEPLMWSMMGISQDCSKPPQTSSERIIRLILAVPYGKVASYGQIAALAGLHNGARQVVRILHSSSGKYKLPWHRIVRSDGVIALSAESGGVLQKELLLSEGVTFKTNIQVDIKTHGWKP